MTKPRAPYSQPTLRPLDPADCPFIFATYLRNRWYSPDNDSTLRKRVWMDAQHKRLKRMLAEKPFIVACLSDDPTVILGYTFQDGPKRWTYVKSMFRGDSLGVEHLLATADLEEKKQL